MRRSTKRRVRVFLRILLIGTLIGTAYGGFIGLNRAGTVFPGDLEGAIDGAAIAAVIAALELFVARTRWGRPVQQAPFLVSFGVKWLVYGMVITAVNAGSLGDWVLGLPSSPRPAFVLLAMLFSFAATFGVLSLFEVSQIVGPRTLRNIVLARYHRPRVEERFFLFIDVAGST